MSDHSRSDSSSSTIAAGGRMDIPSADAFGTDGREEGEEMWEGGGTEEGTAAGPNEGARGGLPDCARIALISSSSWDMFSREPLKTKGRLMPAASGAEGGATGKTDSTTKRPSMELHANIGSNA